MILLPMRTRPIINPSLWPSLHHGGSNRGCERHHWARARSLTQTVPGTAGRRGLMTKRDGFRQPAGCREGAHLYILRLGQVPAVTAQTLKILIFTLTRLSAMLPLLFLQSYGSKRGKFEISILRFCLSCIYQKRTWELSDSMSTSVVSVTVLTQQEEGAFLTCVKIRRKQPPSLIFFLYTRTIRVLAAAIPSTGSVR